MQNKGSKIKTKARVVLLLCGVLLFAMLSPGLRSKAAEILRLDERKCRTVALTARNPAAVTAVASKVPP